MRPTRDSITALIADTPAPLAGRDLLKAAWIETPIGAMLAVADPQALHLLEFFDRKGLPAELIRLRKTARSAIGFADAAPLESLRAELAAYFAGRTANFATRLARHAAGFTLRVWDILAAIPPGATRTYGAIAAELGHPSARAAARANGANQLSIIIPCHRVIGADGDLTGYGGGLARKRWLLDHEQAAFGRPLNAASAHDAPKFSPA
jgi:AraC family transcriptional regulator of adaptative response/methylated-DNA-[protein]-cysteine methyltransferase